MTEHRKTKNQVLKTTKSSDADDNDMHTTHAMFSSGQSKKEDFSERITHLSQRLQRKTILADATSVRNTITLLGTVQYEKLNSKRTTLIK